MIPNQKAQEVIRRITYATVATVSPEGEPWNSPVYCAFDEHFNIYWRSHIGSQHSQNIRANGKAFLVIYDSTVPIGQGEGVYIKAICMELDDPKEIVSAYKLIQDHQPVSHWKLEQVLPDKPRRLYKALPQKIWMNGSDEVDGEYIDVRVEAEEQ